MVRCLLFIFILSSLASCRFDDPIDPGQDYNTLTAEFFYTTEEASLIQGKENISLSPKLSESNQYEYTITPNLPLGLGLDLTTGIIHGTPIVPSNKTIYTVTAQDLRRTYFAKISIEVKVPAPSGVLYPSETISLTQGTYLSQQVPTTLGGPVDHFTLTPSIPPGLNFNTSTGAISTNGSPLLAPYQAIHTITAVNGTGSYSTNIQITINELIPNDINYSSTIISCKTYTPCSSSAPVILPIGTQVTYSISPTLPTGLFLNTLTGEIYGTTNDDFILSSFIITASNTSGSTSKTIQLVVEDNPLDILGYYATSPMSPWFLYVDLPMVNLPPHPTPPSSTVGKVESYSYSSTTPLPPGIEFNQLTGVFSGTPTEITTPTDFTVTVYGQNSVSSISQVIYFKSAYKPITDISYPLAFNFRKNQNIGTLYKPTHDGSSANSYTFELYLNDGITPVPTLPTGLTFNNLTGEITGTPTVVLLNYKLKITVTNPVSTYSEFFNLSIYDDPPSFSYGYSTLNIPVCGSSVSFAPTNTGGDVDNYLISPAVLPLGLSFNNLTGIISGASTSNFAAQTYTITATNSGGTTARLVTLFPLPDIPSFTMNNASFLYQTSQTLSPSFSSCYSDNTFFISPSLLPSDFNLNYSTGALSYTAPSGGTNQTALIARQEYSITASNITGSSTQNFNIELKYPLGTNRIIGAGSALYFDSDYFQDIALIEKECPVLTPTFNCTHATLKIFKRTSGKKEFSDFYTLDLTTLHSSIPFSHTDIKIMKIFDYDLDGYDDLFFIEDYSKTLVVLRNTGNNQFVYHTHYDLSSTYNEAHLVDLDGDSVKEIILNNHSVEVVVFDLNSGILSQYVSNLSSLSQLASMSVIHTDDDDYYDIVAADQVTQRICIIKGLSDYTFDYNSAHCFIPTGSPIEVKSAYLDNDGYQDIVVLNQNGQIDVYQADENNFQSYDGSVLPEVVLDTGLATNKKGLVLHDLNADGSLDISYGNSDSGMIYHFSGTAQINSFQSRVDWISPNLKQLIPGIFTEDIDHFLAVCSVNALYSECSIPLSTNLMP
ncbi:MAG: putative Ig domain-containing protein [Halobacteriovoraceae bacterium]|nr:putative Ig domain-containing protein [Halobacteriovoraceae bacterium]